MKNRISLVVVILVLATMSFAQSAGSSTIDTGFVADFPSGSLLRLQVRSGDVRIVGTERDRIVIRYEGNNADRAKEVKVEFRKSAGAGDLRIAGGPRNNFEIILEVPQKLNLFVRMPFGDLEISKVIGNKDVEVHAGDDTINLGDAKQYGHVDGSVTTGDISAEPFDVEKGGLFRSFKVQGTGAYRIHAHLGAGDLTLRE